MKIQWDVVFKCIYLKYLVHPLVYGGMGSVYTLYKYIVFNFSIEYIDFIPELV